MSRTSLVLFALLGACDGGALIDDPNGEDAEVETHAFSMRVTRAALAGEGEGFDLDGFDTRSSSDTVGCGKVDAEGGVDTALLGQRSALESFGFDLDASLRAAIRDGDLIIDLDVDGYQVGGASHTVSLDVSANGATVAVGVSAEVVGDVLFTTIDALPLNGEMDGVAFQVTVRDVHLELPISGVPESPRVSGGLLAGGLPWDEAGDDDLRGLVLPLVPTAMQAFAESLVKGALDLQPDGSGPCDAISATLSVDAS